MLVLGSCGVAGADCPRQSWLLLWRLHFCDHPSRERWFPRELRGRNVFGYQGECGESVLQATIVLRTLRPSQFSPLGDNQACVKGSGINIVLAEWRCHGENAYLGARP
jgi:hypothetical protein